MRFRCLTALALAFPPVLAAQDGSLLERVRAAMELPVRSNEAREAGVPDQRVRTTIWDIFRSGVPANDASSIVDAEARTVREGGSGDNFGSYVRSQVESGLRGRELADAIHREHARRGMGKPGASGRRDGADEPGSAKNRRDGRPDDAGRRDDAGRSDDARGQGEAAGQDAPGRRSGADRPAQAGERRQDNGQTPRQDTGAGRGRQP